MCSEACPCVYDNYNDGQWDSISADELATFGRAPRLDEDSDLLPMMTDMDMPSWSDLSLQTQAQLQEAGYSAEDEPEPVSNYEQCFESIIQTEAFRENVPEEYQNFFEDFRDQGGFNFLRSIEERYDCGGICYEPLFYLTQDISMGRPTKECFREVLDATIPQIQLYATISGAILLLSFFTSLCICGGIPKDEDGGSSNEQKYKTNDERRDAIDIGSNPSKPGMMY